jgi:predicted O-linked N-acetylglucosamine transferase (SPINDLY family)
MTIQQAFERALQHHQAREFSAAESIYQLILNQQPAHAGVLHYLGVLADQRGQTQRAVELMQQSIALQPGWAEAHFNLATLYQTRGQPELAIESFQKTIALRPDYFEAHRELGGLLLQAGRLDDALTVCRSAAALRPQDPQGLSNLGTILTNMGRLDEAIEVYQQALAIRPQHIGVMTNLSHVLRETARFDESMRLLEAAVKLAPTDAEVHGHLAFLLLLRGELSRGWREYEWRFQRRSPFIVNRNFPQPQWDGSSLANQTILLHAEQGFGDALQFSRYIPLVQSKDTIIECFPELVKLFSTHFPGSRIIPTGEALPPFDVHCPLMTLPLRFGTTLENIPPIQNPLRAPPEVEARWARRMREYADGLKIGLVWAGRPTHVNDRNRSIPLATFAPLAAVTNARFFSLQKGPPGKQPPPAGLNLIDFTSELEDFTDTAGLISQLDVVIAVDTSVAHLAGAMLKPVWLLLPRAPDWRWLLDRDDSPWYPTMKLFRQKQIGDWDEVISRVVHAIGATIQSDDALAEFNLALALKSAGQLEQAIASYRKAIQLRPDFAEAYCNLGDALTAGGFFDQAVEACRSAVAINPGFAEAFNNLGIALSELHRFDEAIAAYRQAIALRSDFAVAWSNLGGALFQMKQLDESITACRTAIRLKPDFAKAHCNLANALSEKEDLESAVAEYRRAIALLPTYAEAFNNLGTTLKKLGHVDEAIAAYRQAIALRPTFFEAHSSLVFMLHYHATLSASAILTEARHWAQLHEQPLAGEIHKHGNDRTADRRLRIGYVSADFHLHPVARFMLPLLEHHDRQQVEIFCYSDAKRPDATTQRVRGACDVWRDISRLNHTAVAEMVRTDAIDILIDLGGHTGENRMPVFAAKPAPVQVSYLGYPGTTGLSAIEYRLTDSFADPPGMTEQHHTEQLIRLPETAWCYAPPADSPDLVNARRDHVRFCSFNNFTKVSDDMLRIWARILREVEGSQLVLKAQGLSSPTVRARALDVLVSQQIDPANVLILPTAPDQISHLAAYFQADIALDTFPYHGTTTTCEALWMGIPVVTRAGDCHVSRVGVSLLSNVGLPELIAESAEQYVKIATELARDRPRVRHLHQTLRTRMRQSPLMDAPAFARNIELACRQIWRTWCEKV